MFEDEFVGDVVEHQLVYAFNDLDAYRRKVEQYLHENRHNLIISKLISNVQVTTSELLELENILFDQGEVGTKEEFVLAFGELPIGRFVRSILGLDINVAKAMFGVFLNNSSFNANQIKFLNMIIDYFVVEGIVEPEMLFSPPFTDINTSGIAGLFDDELSLQIISVIRGINETTVAA
jgi:type I restriction enzyme R subunit